MRIGKRNVFLCILVCWGCEVYSSSAPSVRMGADHGAIRYLGRFTEDYRFGWSGCSIEIVTDATDVRAVMELVSDDQAGLAVVVDGEARFLKVDKDRQLYVLASGLKPGRQRRIGLFKRTEGSKGTIRFKGFELSAGAQAFRPPDPGRKILVIGDSITCGYGNEAKTVEEGNSVENENGYMSYAAIAARELDADVMMLCWSGKGMYRNRQVQNDTADTIPKLFDHTLPAEAGVPWDHSRFIPDVVVINLGTNDMSTQGGKPPLDKEDYISAYTAFISRIRSVAPKSKIILSLGPMAYEPASNWLPEIAAQFNDVTVLLYARPAGVEDRGGHWHPSVKKDKAMAAELAAEVRNVIRW